MKRGKEEYCTITVDELAEILENFTIQKTMFNIVEDFNKNGENTYKVIMLTVEIDPLDDEEAIVVFSDFKKEIQKDLARVLNGFMLSSLKEVGYQWDDMFRALLVLEDGTILIERIGVVE